jgi:hypothetical protein
LIPLVETELCSPHGWHPSHAIAIACTPPCQSNCGQRISLLINEAAGISECNLRFIHCPLFKTNKDGFVQNS